jgi:hypothetical protein
MTDTNKTIVHENANRIIEYLLKKRNEFEQDGVEESSLAGSLALSDTAVREAVDLLENREDVARVPEAIGNPPRFLLKPARGWQQLVERPGEEKQATGTSNS